MNKKILTLLGIALVLSAAVSAFIFLRPTQKEKVSEVPTSPLPTFALTKEEVTALSEPGNTELAQKLAKTADVLDITNCTPNPTILEVKNKDKFTVKNGGNAESYIMIHGERKVTIPANGQVEVTANFSKGPGSYNYGCDAEDNIVGSILITE